MSKNWEKKEYEAKQIASTFWWDSALIQIIFSILFSALLGILLSSLGLSDITLTIISSVLGIAITLLSENIAVKKVRQRAIVKKIQINEIIKSFAIKYVILLIIIVVIDFILHRLDIYNLAIWLVEAFLGTVYAKKLLEKLAVD